MNRRHDPNAPHDSAYLCPAPFYRSGTSWEPCRAEDLSAWKDSFLSDSRSFLRLQPAHRYIADGMDIVNGDFLITDVQSLSNAKTESTARNVKEIVAAQTNLRIIPSFKASAPEYYSQQNILNKGFLCWQSMTFADRRLRSGWQYAVAAGTGYIGPRYDPNFWNRGQGDIVWDYYGPLDILPLGLPPNHDLQRAYAVGLRKKLPIHELWRMFPLMRDQIRADRVSSLGKGMVIAQATKLASAVVRRFSQGIRQPDELATWDSVDTYYIYVDDDSVNETGMELEIRGPDGIWGTTWSYKVPYVGQRLPTGAISSATGFPEYKVAAREDCLIYPNRRLIIATENTVINPDPANQASYRWDGRVPAVQLRCDDWAWNFLGFPATRYGQSLEKVAIELWRGINDQMNLRLNPSAFYDKSSVAQATLQTANPRLPGLRIGLDMNLNTAGSQFSPMLGKEWLATDPQILEAAARILPGIIKDQMGVADVTALARARQLPSGDSQEKLLEAMGPLVKDQSRNMEEGIRMLGEMWKSDWFQFITAKRRMQLLGEDGIAQEDWDYDPGTLVPLNQDLANTDWRQNPVSSRRMPALGADARHFERARWHANNFIFGVTPYSLHEYNSQTRKLFILQMMKVGFPVSWWDMAELLELKNFGPDPMYDDPATGERRAARNMLERYICQLEMQAMMSSAVGAAGGGGGRRQRGRPSTGQTSPVLESKRGGTDSIVRESKH